MRIGITGSWKEEDQKTWGLLPDFKGFKQACHQLGVAIARTRSALTVGSDSAFTADKYAVEGYLSAYTKGLSVRVVRPQKQKETDRPFPDLYDQYPDAFVYLSGPSSIWRHTRQQFVSDVDAMVTIGGGDGTYQAALELRLTRKRLVPIGSFGGASSRLLAELRSPGMPRKEDFDPLSNPWKPKLAAQVVKVLRANRPSRVLLIHGHAKDWIKLKEFLQDKKLAESVIMGEEFTAGQTLPEKFEELADDADAAIALATPDDLASTASGVGGTRARARQNVWVEVGWFWGRLGRSRVLLLLRGDVETPSDLDGLFFFRYRRSVLERKSEIKRFLAQVSKRNQ